MKALCFILSALLYFGCSEKLPDNNRMPLNELGLKITNKKIKSISILDKNCIQRYIFGKNTEVVKYLNENITVITSEVEEIKIHDGFLIMLGKKDLPSGRKFCYGYNIKCFVQYQYYSDEGDLFIVLKDYLITEGDSYYPKDRSYFYIYEKL